MPSRKARKRKRNNNKQTTNNVDANDVLKDVYDTEPNRSWINVRFWSHAMGYLVALFAYYFTAFHPHIMIKGPAKKLIGPLIQTKNFDTDCISLNYYARICLMFWSLHFLRRLFEIFRVQKFYRYAAHSEITGSMMFYGSTAVFNGICNNIRIWFLEGWSCPLMPNITLGLTLFIVGEFGNSYHHYLLRNQRRKYIQTVDANFKGHILPKGGMFDYVSCPHFLFEIITWIGWMFICSFSTGSIMILSITFVTLLMKASQTHTQYKAKFKALYPNSRKALIPFVF